MEEIWLKVNVAGYEDWYDVSSLGRVGSLVEKNRWGNRLNEPSIMSPYKDRHGYFRVVLCVNNNKKRLAVSRLVLMTFNPVTNMEKIEVGHLNNIRDDNRLCNLAWQTRSQNQMQRVDFGTSNRGENQGLSKLTELQVIAIFQEYKKGCITQRELAEKHNVSSGAIAGIVYSKTWSWLTKQCINK